MGARPQKHGIPLKVCVYGSPSWALNEAGGQPDSQVWWDTRCPKEDAHGICDDTHGWASQDGASVLCLGHNVPECVGHPPSDLGSAWGEVVPAHRWESWFRLALPWEAWVGWTLSSST